MTLHELDLIAKAICDVHDGDWNGDKEMYRRMAKAAIRIIAVPKSEREST